MLHAPRRLRQNFNHGPWQHCALEILIGLGKYCRNGTWENVRQSHGYFMVELYSSSLSLAWLAAWSSAVFALAILPVINCSIAA